MSKYVYDHTGVVKVLTGSACLAVHILPTSPRDRTFTANPLLDGPEIRAEHPYPAELSVRFGSLSRIQGAVIRKHIMGCKRRLTPEPTTVLTKRHKLEADDVVRSRRSWSQVSIETR